MSRTEDEKLAYEGDVTWMECPKEDKKFLDFIDSVLEVLDSSDPPPPNPNCSFCQYRDRARQTGF